MEGINIANTHEKSTYMHDTASGQTGVVDLSPAEFSVGQTQEPVQYQESREYDPQQEYQQQSILNVEEKKARRRAKQQVDELLQKQNETEKDRDAFALSMAEKDYLLHREQKERLEERTEVLENMVTIAKEQKDNDAYIKAQSALMQVNAELREKNKELAKSEDIYKRVHEYVEREEPVRNNEALEILAGMSHRRELNSDDYVDWLEDHPEYDPRSEDYSEELADDAVSVKKEFNKHLAMQKMQNAIGTKEYYEVLDSLIEERRANMYGNQQSYAPAPAYNNYAPVSRGNYAPQQQLPALTEFERRIAEVSPMTDIPKPGQMPRPLTIQEKYQRFAEQKARLYGR